MTPREQVELWDVLWLCGTYSAQVVCLLYGMVRVTAPDVKGNTFQNIFPLWTATMPILGYVVARRRQGVVRRIAMRLHAFTCAVVLVDLVWGGVG